MNTTERLREVAKQFEKGVEMTTRELLQMALDALESLHREMGLVEAERTALEAIRAHLAKPEPEPVAWEMWKDGEQYAIKYAKDDRGFPYSWVPLYRKDQL